MPQAAASLHAPGQFLVAPRAGHRPRLAVEVHARQDRDVPGAAASRVVERLEEPVARLAPPRRLGMIDRVGHEIRRHLQKHIGRPQSSISQLAAELAGRLGHVHKLARRPEVRAALEQANVHAIEIAAPRSDRARARAAGAEM